MAMTKTYDPATDRFHYDAGQDGHVVLLGQAGAGDVTLPDGTVIDTKPEAVEVPSQLHGLQLVAHLAGGDAASITQDHVDALNAGETVPQLTAALTPASEGEND